MRAAGGGSQYESWGSLFFRPFVDTVVVALDKATGGLYTQIKQLSKQNLDPMALLQAMVDAQEQAAYVLSNPAVFLQNVMYYFMEEAWRRFSQWVQDLVSASATHTATFADHTAGSPQRTPRRGANTALSEIHSSHSLAFKTTGGSFPCDYAGAGAHRHAAGAAVGPQPPAGPSGQRREPQDVPGTVCPTRGSVG